MGKREVADKLAIRMEEAIRDRNLLGDVDFYDGWNNAVYAMIDIVGEVLLGVDEYAYERTCHLHKNDVLPAPKPVKKRGRNATRQARQKR